MRPEHGFRRSEIGRIVAVRIARLERAWIVSWSALYKYLGCRPMRRGVFVMVSLPGNGEVVPDNSRELPPDGEIALLGADPPLDDEFLAPPAHVLKQPDKSGEVGRGVHDRQQASLASRDAVDVDVQRRLERLVDQRHISLAPDIKVIIDELLVLLQKILAWAAARGSGDKHMDGGAGEEKVRGLELHLI